MRAGKGLAIVVGVLCSLTMAADNSLAASCSIKDREKTEFGPDRGITGECSNNGLSVTCARTDNEMIMCTGPGGDYSGTDLDALIFNACDCAADQDFPGHQEHSEIND